MPILIGLKPQYVSHKLGDNHQIYVPENVLRIWSHKSYVRGLAMLDIC